MHEVLNCIDVSLRLRVFGMKVRIPNPQRLDKCVSLGFVCGAGNRGISLSEELHRVQLQFIPWGITDRGAEAARPSRGCLCWAGVGYAEDLWEFEVPVEEPVAGSERVDRGYHVVVRGAGGQLLEGGMGDWDVRFGLRGE